MAATQPMIMNGPAMLRLSLICASCSPAENGMLDRPRMAAKTLSVTMTRSVPKATVGM